MSWSVFKAKCNVLTGNPHVTKELFAQTIADAYHTCVSLHFDSLTAGGKLTNNAPKLPILNQQILAVCTANLASHQDVDFLKQIGPAIIAYWSGLVIIGPTGTTTIVSPGVWQNAKVPPNTDFQVILNAFMIAARTHIISLTGIYVSSVVVGVTSPWNGSLFQSLP